MFESPSAPPFDMPSDLRKRARTWPHCPTESTGACPPLTALTFSLWPEMAADLLTLTGEARDPLTNLGPHPLRVAVSLCPVHR